MVHSVLERFHIFSGLQANPSKSSLFCARISVGFPGLLAQILRVSLEKVIRVIVVG